MEGVVGRVMQGDAGAEGPIGGSESQARHRGEAGQRGSDEEGAPLSPRVHAEADVDVPHEVHDVTGSNSATGLRHNRIRDNAEEQRGRELDERVTRRNRPTARAAASA